MIPRNLLMPIALGAAIGIPLIAFQSNSPSSSGSSNVSAAAGFEPRKGEAELFGPDNALFFRPVSDMGEILRFDIYPNWVKNRWPRVSTAPSADGLQGMRVALVTGPNTWDICGSLTYYFDQNMRVQRISLVGDTGDASQIAKFLVEKFQFQVHPTRTAGLLTATKQRRMFGVLVLENPPVIQADNPNHQVRVVMELNNPDGKLDLSQSMASVAQTNR